MTFCRNCGRNVPHGSFCTFCGTQLTMAQPMPMHTPQAPQPMMYSGRPNGPETFHTVTVTSKHGSVEDDIKKERGGFGWFLLGFILGLGLITIILLICWWKDFPNRCKSILTGAIVSLILWTAAAIAFFMLGGLEWYINWIESLTYLNCPY